MQLPTWNAPSSLTPDAIERRRRLAEMLMTQGSDASPVQHWTQGAARLAQALAGTSQMNRADTADAALRRQAEMKAAAEKADAERKAREAQMAPDIAYNEGIGLYDKNWRNWKDPRTPLILQEAQKKASARAKTKGRDGREYYLDTGESVFPEGHPANVASTGGLPNAVRTKMMNADVASAQIEAQLEAYKDLVVGAADPTTKIRSGGTGNAVIGQQRDAVKTARVGLQMAMKDAFELGAITGPDMQILNDMIVDPTVDLGSSINPFSDGRGALGTVAGEVGGWLGAGTDIRTRVASNIDQVKAEFRRRMAIQKEKLGQAGLSEAPPPAEDPLGLR
jgi:hypothetical protein